MKPLARGLTLVLFALGATARSASPTPTPTPTPTAPAAAPTPIAAKALDQKLAAQWERFAAARALALTKTVSRDEWEQTLAIPVPFTADERNRLVQWHDGLAYEAKQAAAKASILDLKALRAGSLARVRQFCADFPKGGMLHTHDWGTVSEQGMADLIQRLDPVIHPQSLHDALTPGSQSNSAVSRGEAYLYPEELAFLQGLAKRYGPQVHYRDLKPQDQDRLRALLFLKNGSHPFARFQAVFTLIYELVLNKPAFDPNPARFEDFYSRAQAENLIYVETSEPVDLSAQAFGGLDGWAQGIQKRYGITARLLEAFFRASPVDELAASTLKLLALPPSKILIGVNLVNNEDGNPALEKGQPIYVPILKAVEAHRSELHRTIHAGELGDSRNVRDALILGAERIGHGVALADDPVTLEYARLHHVPIEANLTSNVRLRVVRSYRDHPFLRFLRLGLPVSLSTDDEGILGTDINGECTKAIVETDINYWELRELAWNSLETAFVEEPIKRQLEDKLAAQLAAFEKRWKALSPR
jgi:adenosine deaminase